MAEYTNNYKYIAEAWIENGEEEGFKTAFLASLFYQWQGHSDDEQNPKFNADMVDGRHYEDISNEISDAVADTVKKFYIGYTYFEGQTSDIEYKIGIEAVHLYPDISQVTMEPADFLTYVNAFEFPWDSSEEYEIGQLTTNENPNIYQIIKELYYQLNQAKADNNEFQDFKENQIIFNDDVSDALSRFHITEDGLDASTVNGLRFFVVTQSQYEAYAAEVRQNIHNVFIIKEPGEISSYYESLGEENPQDIYKQNPDIAPWNRAYMFKVDVVDGETYLMYKLTGEDDVNWQIIAPTSDFVDIEYIRTIIAENVPQGTKEYFKNLNHTLNANNNNDYKMILNFPTTNVYDKRYISGALSSSFSYNSNNDNIIESSQKVEVPITQKNGLQFLDFSNSTSNILGNLKDSLNSRITSLKTRFDALNTLVGNINDSSSQQTVFGKINQNQANISANTNTINNLINGATINIKDAQDELLSLDDRLTSLGSTVENNEKFDILFFNKYRKEGNLVINTNSLFGISNIGSVFIKKQGMCFAYFYLSTETGGIAYKLVDDPNHVGGKMPNYVSISAEPIPEGFRPAGQSEVFVPITNWNSGTFGVLKIAPNGYIYYANTVANQKSNAFNFLANCSYPCKGAAEYLNESTFIDMPTGTNINLTQLWS